MGSLVVSLRQLLSKPQLVLDEWMPLDGASPDSEILLRAELKVREKATLTTGVNYQREQHTANVYRS